MLLPNLKQKLKLDGSGNWLTVVSLHCLPNYFSFVLFLLKASFFLLSLNFNTELLVEFFVYPFVCTVWSKYGNITSSTKWSWQLEKISNWWHLIVFHRLDLIFQTSPLGKHLWTRPSVFHFGQQPEGRIGFNKTAENPIKTVSCNSLWQDKHKAVKEEH